MAKLNNLTNTERAMEAAAMNETTKKEKAVVKKVTQKEGSKQVFLKKFPIEWHDLIRTMHSGAMSDYVMIAVAEKMRRDGLL